MFATRILLIAALVSAFATLPAGSLSAAERDPEAFVVDSDGEIVAVAHKRADAQGALRRAEKARPAERLRIEYIYRSHGTVPSPPNDPAFPQQWNFEKVGVPSAWAHVDGSGVVVAVLDSAVNFTGRDGFCTPVVSPYDAINQTEGLADLNTTAAFGHGTHIAGTIAQCTNNSIGVAGIAPGATLMPIRVLDDDGLGNTSSIKRAIDWAVDHGADIINMSLGAECESTWGPTCNDPEVDAAISRANAAGLILVASSGNEASTFLGYPSTHPDVVSVGSTTPNDAVWFIQAGVGSNGGSTLDLVAPGTGILQETTSSSSSDNDYYDYFSATGTSMAAPHVSAAAALVLSVDPSMTADEVVSTLKSTARDIAASGYDATSGWGRLDVAAAVAAVIPPQPSENPCPRDPCDSVVRVDPGGIWGLWEGLYESSPVSTFYYGNPGDVPFMGDWNGDGLETPGLFRQLDGYVYVRHTNTQGNANVTFFFGNPGDLPLVGDFDGDGRDSVSIWRRSQRRVYIIDELGEDGKGLGAADYFFDLADENVVPFVGDFDGDGIETVGYFDPSDGTVHLRNSNSAGPADVSFRYGNPGDQILVGDWDGDGTDTVSVYRPSTGFLYVSLQNTSAPADWSGFIGSYPWAVTAGKR